MKKFWKLCIKRKSMLAACAVILIFALCALFPDILAAYSPKKRSGTPFEPPSVMHVLGTNDMGVDVLSELIFSARMSLTIGLIIGIGVTVLGCLVGVASGYFGGVTDEVLMRFTDVVLILPRVPLMIMLAAFLGPGMWTIILVLLVVGWASVARQVRAQVMSVKQQSFVESARAMGAGSMRIMMVHIMPNVTGVLVVNLILEIMFAILAEAGLSFLGLGDPTQKSWGLMLSFAQSRGAFLRGAWWWLVPPGLCIAALSVSFNILGTGINDHFVLKLNKG